MLNRAEDKFKRLTGYSMIEMLIVCGVILILATVPIALLRRSREKVYEAEAVRGLGMMALAYENYYAQNGHKYPNYRSDHALAADIQYKDAESVWDDLNRMGLLPRQYAEFPYDKRDLLARGYVLSIFPADYGSDPGIGARNRYAIGLVPYPDSVAKRSLAVIQGQRFFNLYPTAIPRKIKGTGLSNTTIYTLPD